MSIDDSNGNRHGFLLSNGEFMTVQMYREPLSPSVDGINPRGDIAGEYRDASDNVHSLSAEQWVLYAHRLTGRRRLTDVEGINARGDIVGFYIDSSGNFHGLLLSRWENLPPSMFREQHQTFGCFGISPRGDIVGSTIDSSGNDHGFLLSDGKFTTIDFPGAVATDLNDINPSGDIVGQYADSDGNEHGFLLSK